MSLSTTAVVLPTYVYTIQDRGTQGCDGLSAIADDIQTTWNNGIDYPMTVDVDCTTIDIRDYSPSNAWEAVDAAQDVVTNDFPGIAQSYDAVLVRDARDWNYPEGAAPPGKPTAVDDSENFAAGSVGKQCVGYCSTSLSSHLEAHEVGHMYGGRHKRHERYGWWEHTVMGNSGAETCSGVNSDGRTRTNEWNGCVYSDITTYMDHWHSKRGVF